MRGKTLDRKTGAAAARPFISLRIKILAAVLAVLLAGLVTGSCLVTKFMSDRLMENAGREVLTIAGFILDRINTEMLTGDTDKVREVLAGLARNSRVTGVWLTNHEGIVVATSFPKDLGNVRPHTLPESCATYEPCILIPESPTAPDGGAVYSQTLRIENRPECLRCHMGDGPVLGWLTVDISIQDTVDQLESMKARIAGGALMLVLVLVATVSYIMTRIVNRPIEDLASAIKRAETDLDTRFDIRSNDEIKLLYAGFNSLLDRLKSAKDMADSLHNDELARYSRELESTNRELDDKVKKLSALSVIGRNMNEIRKLDDLLKMVLNTALRELSGRSGSVMLYEKGVDELFIHCGIGLSPEGHRKNRFRMGEGIAGWVAEHKKSVMTDSAITDVRYAPGRGMKHDIALLCVPFLGSGGNMLGVINVERPDMQSPFSTSDLEYLTAMAGQAAVAIENVELIQDLQKSYYDTISALAMTVEAKDPYTLGHSKRVTQYSMAIADEMGLSEKDLQTIQYGATLHDIGKIGVRESVLNKPGVLTREEYVEIMDHAVIGENIISGVDFLQATRPIIRNHQERHDGKGYPDGLAGDDIPIMVAIVSVADNYDALTTDRPYRKAFQATKVIDIIKEEAGTKFNPVVVEAFLRIFEDKGA